MTIPLDLLEMYGSELSLLFMIIFVIYQMYSPDALPQTKGQKFIGNILETLRSLNSQKGDGTSVPHRNKELGANKDDSSYTRDSTKSDTRR